MTGSRNTLPMLAGAMAAGMLDGILDGLAQPLRQAAVGRGDRVTFTWLFAIGVILVSRFTGMVDLDVECVLYGEIIFTPLDTVSWGGYCWGRGPLVDRAGLTGKPVFRGALLGKQLKICTFDAGSPRR